jgi:hypothetical protein
MTITELLKLALEREGGAELCGEEVKLLTGIDSETEDFALLVQASLVTTHNDPIEMFMNGFLLGANAGRAFKGNEN